MQRHLLEAFQKANENVVNSKARTIRPYLVRCMANLESAQNSDLTADEFLKEIQSRCAKNAGSVPIPRQSSQKASAMLGNSQAQLQMEQHHREAIAAIQDRIHHDIELAIQHLGLAPKSKQEDDHDDDDEFFVEEITNAAVIRHK